MQITDPVGNPYVNTSVIVDVEQSQPNGYSINGPGSSRTFEATTDANGFINVEVFANNNTFSLIIKVSTKCLAARSPQSFILNYLGLGA